MKQVLYRILTEATGAYRENAIDCAERYYDGFTVVDGFGFWNGAKEPTVVIEIAGVPEDLDTILLVAANIRALNKQQSVMVQTVNCTFECI